MTDDGLRASDSERERVIKQLERALVHGRLSTTEFDERLEAALVARTTGDLEVLTRDLPRSLW